MELAPEAESARAARRFVRAELTRLGREELIEAAELGVGELTANVALHARTSCRVSVATTGSGRVRIAVTDSSPWLPRAPRRGQLAGTGRGLRLVAVAGRWGIERASSGTGKTIWFEPRDQLDEGAFATGPSLSALAP